MADEIFCHIGLPKTGTSYVQGILWSHRDQLRADGVLLPGSQRRDHLWASRIIRGEGFRADDPAEKSSAWDRLLAELGAWPGRALLSHEFFCGASEEQAQRMVADLAPASVHLIITAREPLGLFTASWQESLKNRGRVPLSGYSRTVSEDPREIWNWRALDLGLVLQRWVAAVSPSRVHVIPVGGQAARRADLWERFADVVGLSASAYDTSAGFPNPSLGVVEAETLRRINEHLDTFERSYDRGVYIRTFLADERLAPRSGERFWPAPEQILDCRRRGDQSVDLLGSLGVEVVGDRESLRVPAELPARRTPESVTDAEVATVATQLVARLLEDVRALRQERARLASATTGTAAAPALRPRWRRWRPGRIRRSG